MTRQEILNDLRKHPITGNLFKKLTVGEAKFIDDFLEANANDDSSQLAHKINRLFIGDLNKPKHHDIIWAILCEMVSAEIFSQRRPKI